jgi:hypothetical protein
MGYDVGMALFYRLLRLKALFGVARWLYLAYRRRKAERAAAATGIAPTNHSTARSGPYPPTEP